MTRRSEDQEHDALDREFTQEVSRIGPRKSKLIVVTLFRRQGNVYPPPPPRSWVVQWFGSAFFLLTLCLVESGVGLLLGAFNLLDRLLPQYLIIIWIVAVGLFVTAFGLMLGSGQIKKMDASIWVPSLILWFLSVGVIGPLATWGRTPWVIYSTDAQLLFIFVSLGVILLTINAGILFAFEALRVIKA